VGQDGKAVVSLLACLAAIYADCLTTGAPLGSLFNPSITLCQNMVAGPRVAEGGGV
jgi:hypothetical protein